MRHRILTCKNHRDLRWSCKDVAWTGGYNGTRSIFFNGTPTGEGMYADGSGLHTDRLRRDEFGQVVGVVEECACPASDMILAPEDALVTA